MARPIKWSEAMAPVIAATKSGADLRTAAKAGGVHRKTIYVWLHRAERGEEPFVGFARDLKAAQQIAHDEWAASITAACAPAPYDRGSTGHLPGILPDTPSGSISAVASDILGSK